jgi:hypothetical protein
MTIIMNKQTEHLGRIPVYWYTSTWNKRLSDTLVAWVRYRRIGLYLLSSSFRCEVNEWT